MTTNPKAPTELPSGTNRDEVRQRLIDRLQAMNGKSQSALQLSRFLGIGAPAIRTMCIELCKEGALRVGRTEFDTEGYYFPTEDQKNLERRLRDAATVKPLKPRTAHREAVERAMASRRQYASHGGD